MEEKNYTKWTKKEFESLPSPPSFHNNIGEVDCLVIIPTRHTHDSGYRCMKFAVIQNGIPTYLVSGCSDVIHLGGIGGYNKCIANNSYINRVENKQVPVCSWSIDCLPTSGLLRIFCDKKMYLGASLSSFEIFFKED